MNKLTKYVNEKVLGSDRSPNGVDLFRIEYDAFRVDLEELNLQPRDASTLPKLERAQKEFQNQRERYEKIRDDLNVKVKLLEENKVNLCSSHVP